MSETIPAMDKKKSTKKTVSLSLFPSKESFPSDYGDFS